MLLWSLIKSRYANISFKSGVPGSSYAFELAERLGISRNLLMIGHVFKWEMKKLNSNRFFRNLNVKLRNMNANCIK